MSSKDSSQRGDAKTENIPNPDDQSNNGQKSNVNAADVPSLGDLFNTNRPKDIRDGLGSCIRLLSHYHFRVISFLTFVFCVFDTNKLLVTQ